MVDHDLKTVCGNCEFPIQERPEHERAPCPKCGSTTRKFFAEFGGELKLSGEVTASLSKFVDQSSPETADASATALTCIALWVDKTDALTVRHVINKHLSPSKTDVQLGPYTEDEFREIVATVFEDSEDKRVRRWDRTKTLVGWGFAAIAALIAYLTFVRG